MLPNESLFGELTRREHAYALGYVAGAGRVSKDVVFVSGVEKESALAKLLRRGSAAGIPTVFTEDGRTLRIGAPHGAIAAGFLGGPPGDRERARFPELGGSLVLDFVRGIFDGVGELSRPRSGHLSIAIPPLGRALTEGVALTLGSGVELADDGWIRAEGANALDVLGRLYDLRAVDEETGDISLFRRKYRRRYLKWAHRILGVLREEISPELRVQRTRSDAILPGKERVSDSGYDLTLLYEAKRVGNVVLYGTGLRIDPPYGWYIDVVPRSSIIKRGYIIANSVGIIDRTYRGELLVPLIKLDPSVPELELPARVAQMIPRPIAHFPVREVSSLDETVRGSGGFGSTG